MRVRISVKLSKIDQLGDFTLLVNQKEKRRKIDKSYFEICPKISAITT
jgi:hypothetical protein